MLLSTDALLSVLLGPRGTAWMSSHSRPQEASGATKSCCTQAQLEPAFDGTSVGGFQEVLSLLSFGYQPATAVNPIISSSYNVTVEFFPE